MIHTGYAAGRSALCRSRLLLLPALLALAGACGQPVPVERSGTTDAGVSWRSSGSGPAVVLLHAFSLDSRMWDGLAADLAGEFQVIRYDSRGHGESSPATEPYSSYLDLAQVLDAAGVERSALVGLSSGSQTAMDFALAFPDRTTRLVLASPSISGYTPRGSFGWMAPVGEGLRAGGPGGAAAAWLETPLMALAPDAPGAAAVRRIAMDNSGIWALDPHPDLPPEPAAATRLGAVGVPTLVLVGSRDLLDTRLIAALLDYCLVDRRVQVVPTGHLMSAEEPELFSGSILRFLRGADPGPLPLSAPPPGCGEGEDLMGPGSLAPLARIVGGSWTLGESHQVFSWGVGRRSISGEMYFASDGTPRLVSQFMWYWHPDRELFEGRGVAIEMGIDLFEYDTRVMGDTLVSELRTFGPAASADPQVESWTFQGPDVYLWQLFQGGAEPIMDGLFQRVWGGEAAPAPAPRQPGLPGP